MIGLSNNVLHVEDLIHPLRRSIILDAWFPDLLFGFLHHSCGPIQLEAEEIYPMDEEFGRRLMRQYRRILRGGGG